MKLNKLVIIFLLLYVISTPMGISSSQIALGFAFLFWIIGIFSKKIPLIRSKLDLPILLFLLCGLIASLFGISPLHNLNGFRTMGWMLIYFLVVNNVKEEKDSRRLIEVLILATAVSATYGIFQYLANCQRPGPPVRSGGIMGSYMVFGHHLALTLPFAAALLFIEEGKKKKTIFGVAILIMFGCLIFTFTRGAWLGAAFGLFLMGILKSKRGWYLIPAGILLLITILFAFPKSYFAQRIKTTITLQDGSAQERIYLWKATSQMIKDRPLLGYGWEGFRKVYPKYVLPRAKQPGLVHAHNTFLDICIDCGIIGLGIFIWLFALLIYSSYRLFKYAGGKYSKMMGLAAIGSFTGFLIGGLTQYNFGRSDNAMLLYFLMGIIMALYPRKTK